MSTGQLHELLAQSLYEELSPEEQQQLDRALAESAELREEAEALRNLVQTIPVHQVDTPENLHEAIVVRVRARQQRRAWIAPHWALAAAAFVLVAAGVVFYIGMYSPTAVAPGVATAPDASGVGSTEEALARAQRLETERRYAEAYALVARAADNVSGEADAAILRQHLADLAFEDLQWYDEAFEQYDVLRREHPEQFAQGEENFFRLNLLDETRGLDGRYAALRELDAAERSGKFDALESVIAQRPGTYVASLAARSMADVVAANEDLPGTEMGQARAMRMAQLRSSNPVVKAQLRLEAAHMLRDSAEGRSQARVLYEKAADSPITVIAEVAQQSLQEMNQQAPETTQNHTSF